MASLGILSRSVFGASKRLNRVLNATCPGDELYNYLLRHGPLPIAKVQKIFTQLLGAVTHVHDLSCVHRDLKLENILLDKHENVKLVDFGFTREYEGKASYLQTFCGTVCYSAPEMLKGEKYAGEKVDVWSLGVILYALVTGELPFDEDEELATKHKILSIEPKYPETMPADVKTLIMKLLSKRPLYRPSLADILTNPFLAEYAPAQQAILKLPRAAPFTSRLEKDTLERMRSAGIEIDLVIENVLAQRCDSLAGWWALLIEKEERKEMRRERKRREREQEAKSLRRISATSSRMERMTPTLIEVDEGASSPRSTDGARSRGRRERRSFPNRMCRSILQAYLCLANLDKAQIIIPDLPRLPEGATIESPSSSTPPPPIEKDSIRSASSSRHRPPPPPKSRERRRSRGSTLQLVSTNPELLAPPNVTTKRRPRRRQLAIINQLASIKHWFMESAKRGKSPAGKSEASTLKAPGIVERPSPKENRRTTPISENLTVPRDSKSQPPNHHSPKAVRTPPPRLSSSNRHRVSISPAPLTPISYRRSSAGLRGRKSTSSSISSIRSIHHIHTHSKASSTSSTSNSITSGVTHRPTPSRSPHTSVKVLPATPTTSAFPSAIRVSRTAPTSSHTQSSLHQLPPSGFPPAKQFNETASFIPGLIFAKRKRTPFRGPRLDLHATTSSTRERESSLGRSQSGRRRRSGETIAEVDEEEVEEVDTFGPIQGPGTEETVWEGDGAEIEESARG